MKHRVAELEGGLLDAAVAKAEGLPMVVKHGTLLLNTYDEHQLAAPHRYSERWELAGPIIERAWIRIDPHPSVMAYPAANWRAKRRAGGEELRLPTPEYTGPTPLVAAMRAYVASVYGEEVDLPT